MQNTLIYDGNRRGLVAMGDEAFLNKIRNFIANFVFVRKNEERSGAVGTLFFHVSEDDLFAGFAKEGYGLKMCELLKAKGVKKVEDEDLPDNIDDLVREYNRQVISGNEAAINPCEKFSLQETPEMIDEAKIFSFNYAQEEMDKLERTGFFAGMTNLGLEEFGEGGSLD